MEIPELTLEEIQELNVHAAQRKLLEITRLLTQLNGEMFVSAQELGNARVRVEQQKNTKNTLIEIARALKAVIQNG
jgi:hypothetical protein